MYNLTKINGTNPAVLVKSVSDTLLSSMMEEIILVFFLIVAFAAFYYLTRDFAASITRAAFAIMIFALFFVWLEWITGWTFFVFVAIYAISLLIAKLGE